MKGAPPIPLIRTRIKRIAAIVVRLSATRALTYGELNRILPSVVDGVGGRLAPSCRLTWFLQHTQEGPSFGEEVLLR